MLQKLLISSLLTVSVLATGTALADSGMYPPMGQTAGAVPPPPLPVFNNGYPQNNPAQYSRPMPPQYGPPMNGYGRPAPYGQPMPYAGGAPYGPGPRPYPGQFGPGPNPGQFGPRPGPWNNGGFNQAPWGGRGFGNNNNPFNKMFNSRYGGIWGMRPDEWVKAGPEDGFSYMWDDVINAPSEMGEMPGGWNAPSISVPNPVDIGSEFRREAPNLAREIPNMINVN